MPLGPETSSPFLAAFLSHKVLTLKEELEAKAIINAHLRALMPALAERGIEQAKILRAVQRVVRIMDTKTVALQGWLSGNFVDAALLPISFAQVRDGCAEWDFKSFHRGVFPWRLVQIAWNGKSEIELLTELALRISEHQRAQQELSLIDEEVASSLQLYARQASALVRALASIPQQSPSHSGKALQGEIVV